MARLNPLDRERPRDAETERRFLGAVLILGEALIPDHNREVQEEFFAKVTAQDFGDPFNWWLYSVIMEARGAWPTWQRQLKFIMASITQREAKERFGIDRLFDAIRPLLETREGDMCCGRVTSIRAYHNHLRQIRDYREMVEHAITAIGKAYEYWDNALEDGFVAPD